MTRDDVIERVARALYDAGASCGECEFDSDETCVDECSATCFWYAKALDDAGLISPRGATVTPIADRLAAVRDLSIPANGDA